MFTFATSHFDGSSTHVCSTKKNLADIDGHAAKAAVDGRQTAVEQLQTVERRTWTEDCGQKTVGAAYVNAALLMRHTRRETITQIELDMFSKKSNSFGEEQ